MKYASFRSRTARKAMAVLCAFGATNLMLSGAGTLDVKDVAHYRRLDTGIYQLETSIQYPEVSNQ